MRLNKEYAIGLIDIARELNDRHNELTEIGVEININVIDNYIILHAVLSMLEVPDDCDVVRDIDGDTWEFCRDMFVDKFESEITPTDFIEWVLNYLEDTKLEILKLSFGNY